jgi:hypothetical protein
MKNRFGTPVIEMIECGTPFFFNEGYRRWCVSGVKLENGFRAVWQENFDSLLEAVKYVDWCKTQRTNVIRKQHSGSESDLVYKT